MLPYCQLDPKEHIQWHFIQKSKVFTQGSALINVICQMAAILLSFNVLITVLSSQDLGLAQNAATATQTPTPLGSLAHQIYRMMTNGEYAEKDFSSVFKFLEQMKK